MTMFGHGLVKSLVTVLVLGLWATAAHAQISQAALQGTIKDNSGAVIPGATVTLRNKGTAATRSTTTGPAGQYALQNVDPAEYSLTVSFTGFKTYIIESLVLHTGEITRTSARFMTSASRTAAPSSSWSTWRATR